jgi:electron transfer flavoprotein beta subunit
MKLDIPILSAENMELDEDKLGLNGSPTRVVNIATPRITRGGRTIRVQDGPSLTAAADEFLALLEAKGILS